MINVHFVDSDQVLDDLERRLLQKPGSQRFEKRAQLLVNVLVLVLRVLTSVERQRLFVQKISLEAGEVQHAFSFELLQAALHDIVE